MHLEVGKTYRLRDGGTIRVQSKHTSPTPGGGLGDAYRTVSETGEVLFYDTYGRILPIDGGGGLARFNVEREVTSHG